MGGVASLSAAQEISDVEDLSEYDLDSPQNEITLTTDDGDTVLQIGMENESTAVLCQEKRWRQEGISGRQFRSRAVYGNSV